MADIALPAYFEQLYLEEFGTGHCRVIRGLPAGISNPDRPSRPLTFQDMDPKAHNIEEMGWKVVL